jgi:multidrug efflux pump subunit AcrB
MIASFLLASSLVPVLSVWWLGGRPPAHGGGDWVEGLRNRLARVLQRLAPARGLLVAAYLVVSVGTAAAVGLTLGREIFPPSGINAFQLRFRAPAGTKFEATESLAREVLDVIRREAGPDNVDITLGYVGVQPTSYPVNLIFLWTGGSHEGVLQVALRSTARLRLDDLQERLRGAFHDRFPDAQFSFEPGDIVGRIMNFGAPTPIEVAVMGPDSRPGREEKKEEGAGSRGDALAIGSTSIAMAAQLGVTVDQIGRSLQPPRPRAASWPRTTGRTRARASPSRCRSRSRSPA